MDVNWSPNTAAAADAAVWTMSCHIIRETATMVILQSSRVDVESFAIVASKSS